MRPDRWTPEDDLKLILPTAKEVPTDRIARPIGPRAAATSENQASRTGKRAVVFSDQSRRGMLNTGNQAADSQITSSSERWPQDIA